MTKKIAILLTVLLFATCIFASCAKEDYTFTALSTEGTGGDVVSNGGMALQQGDYYYYVNGAVSYALDNTFGSVLEGSIVRVKITDLNTCMNDTNGESTVTIDTAAQVVVPKIVYSGYTTNKTSNGFYIFGNRIYYTTPNTELDKNGGLLNTELCVKSCKLDGTDTVNHYTLSASSYQTCIGQAADGSVYLMYVDTSVLYSAKLDGANVKSQELCEVGSVTFDPQNSKAYILNADSNILSAYVPGGEVTQVIPANNAEPDNGAFKNTISMKMLSGNELIIAITDSSLTNWQGGIYRVAVDNTVTLVSIYQPATYFVYGKYLLILSDTYTITLRDTSLGTDNESTIESAELSASPTFVKCEGGYFYYNISNILYRTQIFDDNGVTVSDLINETVSYDTNSTSTGAWTSFDIVGDKVFYFNSSSISIGTTTSIVYPAKVIDLSVVIDEGGATGFDVTKYTIGTDTISEEYFD